MNGETANRDAFENEARVKKQFEKLNYSVERLDRNNDNRRPDFLISTSPGHPLLLCEVKTINSAGQGVSTRNPNLKRFSISLNRIHKQIDDRIENAADQRKELIKERPQLGHLPFVVALFPDPLVPLHIYSRKFNEDVSGILTIERDAALGTAFSELSDGEQERRLRTGDAIGLPPNTTDFALVRNKSARRRVPKSFQNQCNTESYSDSL
ncbi:MAG TPA: hypothetical protein VGI25_02680 [Candidatus Udaeobacter sp.]